eukprot:PhF_6_TR36516/c0_g1_i3/m.53784
MTSSVQDDQNQAPDDCCAVLNKHPRALLIAGAALSLLVTAIVIIALMATLYTEFVTQRELTNLETMVNILGEYTIAFERTWVSNAGDELLDQTFTTALSYELMFRNSCNRMQQRIKEDTQTYSQILRYVDEYARSQEQEKVKTRLHQMRSMFETLQESLSVVMLQRVITRLLQETSDIDYLFALDYTSSTVLIDTKSFGNVSYDTYYNTPCQSAARLEKTSGVLSPAVAYTYIPSLNVGICAYLSSSKHMTKGTAAAVPVVDIINNVRSQRNKDTRWVTPNRRVIVGSDGMPSAAETMKPPSESGTFLWRVDNLDNPSLTIVDSQSFEETAEAYRRDIIQITEYENWEFDRTTEIIISRVDSNNHLDCQTTQFRFNATCHEDCYRTPASCRNVFNAYSHGTSNYITPDYRPEPVQGAFAWMNSGLNIGMGFERDVLEIRGRGLKVLVAIADSINSKVKGSTRTHLVHYAGMPPMKVFNVSEPCDTDTCRISLEGKGIIFRRDCPHCMRQPQVALDSIEFLTALNDCPFGESRRCKKRSQKLSGPAVDVVEASQSSIQISEYVDYRKVDVLAGGVFLDNLTVGIFVKTDKRELMSAATEILTISACSGVGLALFGLGVLLYICRGMLHRIEVVLEALLARNVKHAPRVGDVAMIFTDIQNSTKMWNANSKLTERAVEMHHAVIRHVINKHRAYEVKTMGDSFMIATNSATKAVQIANSIQLALMAAAWDDDLLLLEDARVEECWFRGLRVRIGIHI